MTESEFRALHAKLATRLYAGHEVQAAFRDEHQQRAAAAAMDQAIADAAAILARCRVEADPIPEVKKPPPTRS